MLHNAKPNPTFLLPIFHSKPSIHTCLMLDECLRLVKVFMATNKCPSTNMRNKFRMVLNYGILVTELQTKLSLKGRTKI